MSGRKACVKDRGVSLNEERSISALLDGSVSGYGAAVKGNNFKNARDSAGVQC